MQLTLIENNLLPIYQYDSEEVVLARNVWEWVESKQDYSNWFQKRCQEFEAIKSRDFIELPEEMASKSLQDGFFNKKIEKSKGRSRIDHLVTIEFAKHLAMMERNHKGREARQYFIDFEKKVRDTLKAKDAHKEALYQAYLKELGPWEKMFPRSFYDGLYRLLGWEIDPIKSYGHPGYIGTLTKKLVHSKLAPGLLERLEQLNPSENGRRKHIHTQFLTDDIGKAQIQKQIEFVLRMMPLVTDIDALTEIVETDYHTRYGGDRQLKFIKTTFELVHLDSYRPTEVS